MIVYGLHTCTVCQRAIKTLSAQGHMPVLRDIRDDPMNEAEWAELIAEFGDRMVDRTTNDWRSLSDWLKHSEAEEQLAAKPKLMTRPVIRAQTAGVTTLYLGWTPEIEAELAAAAPD